ncbi:hypothetical protein V5O48_011546 [Marasmius crinis-equi]|uniref:Uncharacterized protein n=1 Tax=Marasmius crinis-equi TaxID=585013 RepID=A0ABR3F5N7_9AGAR
MPYLTSEIPWEGVTDFTTGNFTTPSVHQSFYKVLPLLQNIQTWHLAQVTFAHLRDTPREAFTLPRLHTLILDHSHPPEIFNVLVTPSLRSLIFECSVHVNTLKHIHTLIAHSSCSIESLLFDEIYGEDMDNEWVNFSREKPIRESIRNLQLPLDLLAQPRVLRAFHFVPEEDVYPVFPHLRSLTMYGDTLTSRSRTLSSEVVDMLASRRNVENLNFVVGSVSPLEMFFSRGPVDSFELTELETVSRFKELRRGGLVYSRIMD